LYSEGSKNLLLLPSGVDLCAAENDPIWPPNAARAAQTRPSMPLSTQLATELGNGDAKSLKRALSQVSQLGSQISLNGDSSTVSAIFIRTVRSRQWSISVRFISIVDELPLL